MKTNFKNSFSIFYILLSRFLLAILFSIFYFLFSNSPVLAAVLYLEPPTGQYRQNDTFLVDLNIDTRGKCINAAEIHLRFSQDVLEGIDFSKGESILNFWIEGPTINQGAGLVSFTGGIPGGYCGILPGDPREHSHLGRIAFRATNNLPLTTGNRQLATVNFLDTSRVLLNDGLGTPAELTFRHAAFTILPGQEAEPRDQWQEKLERDNIPPEPFEIKINKDPAIFEGKYFIVFSTTDKQSGMNYFEIHEAPPIRTPITANWKRAESPYLLEDQTLRSIIRVRAVDKAGNERIVELPPTRQLFPYWAIILIVLALVVAGAAWRIARRKKLMKI